MAKITNAISIIFKSVNYFIDNSIDKFNFYINLTTKQYSFIMFTKHMATSKSKKT